LFLNSKNINVIKDQGITIMSAINWVDLKAYNAILSVAVLKTGKTFFRISPSQSSQSIDAELDAFCKQNGMMSKSGSYAYEHNAKNSGIAKGLLALTHAKKISVEAESVGFPAKEKPSKRNPDSNNPRHFFLTDETVRTAGFEKTKRFNENRVAIGILNTLEIDQRYATDNEKKEIAKYNGWGGLQDYLDGFNYSDSPAMREGKQWLTDTLEKSSIRDIRHNTLTGFLTSPEVARAIWSGVSEAGFKSGRILEPAVGSGVFLGTMPEHIVDNSFITTIDKEEYSSRTAAALYPDARHFNDGLESVKLPNSSFDLVITNVPFGNFSVNDKAYRGKNLSIHDYFINKSLDLMKPDAIGAFITSRYTMDSADSNARRMIAKKGELLAAIRMPSNAQKSQAGVEVVTDLLIFKRRRKEPSFAELESLDWLHSSLDNKLVKDINKEIAVERSIKDQLYINNYFKSQHVIGEFTRGSANYGRPELQVMTNQSVAEWSTQIPSLIKEQLALNAPKTDKSDSSDAIYDYDYSVDIEQENELNNRTASLDEFRDATTKHGSYISTDEGVAVITGVKNNEVTYTLLDLTGKKLDRVLAMITIRDAMNEAISIQKDDKKSDLDLKEALLELNTVYDEFVKKYGFLNDPVNSRLFYDDPEAGRLRALEKYDEDKKTAEKADIFRTRVIRQKQEVKIETPEDALNYVFAHTGTVDTGKIAALINLSEEDAIEVLSRADSIFLNPATDEWELAAKYLSGDVKTKLEQANDYVDFDSRFQKNIDALQEVIPADILPDDIEVSMGASWLTADLIKGFLVELIKEGGHFSEDLLKVDRTNDEKWLVDIPAYIVSESVNLNYGTRRVHVRELVDRMISGTPIAVYDTIRDPKGKKVKVLNSEETITAQDKAEQLLERFKEYIFNDQNREQSIKLYNDLVNRNVDPVYNGDNFVFPGMSASIELRSVQKAAVVRQIIDGRQILAHKVGVGKTYTMIASAIESKRLGLASKPSIIVPNHMIEQIHREGLQLYPDSNVLAITRDDLKAENRKQFLGKVTNNNWDLIIMTHGVFSDIPLDPEFVKNYITDEIAEIETSLSSAIDMDAKRFTIKQIENRLARAQTKLEEITDSIEEKTDPGTTFGMIGIDWLAVDEFHNFKNLGTSASNQDLTISGSQRATDLHMKTTYLYQERGSVSGILLASGTPVSNNIAELHVAQRYIQPDILKEKGMTSIDSWSHSFIKYKSQFEPAPGGNGFKLRARPILVNAPELLGIVRQTMDVKTAEDAGITLPTANKQIKATPMTARQEAITKSLAERADRLQKSKVDPREDNILKIVSEGRQLALHDSLLDPEKVNIDLPDDNFDDEWTKIDEMVADIVDIYHRTTEFKGAQAVFCDMGTPSAARKGKANAYDLIKTKLIDQGIPEEEIAFAHDAKNDKQKEKLFSNVREGNVRCVIGSTSKMGEGTNMQLRLAALHHLDPPWRPSDIEQRDGRILRFGNMFIEQEGVDINIYTTKGSFDEYMWTTMKAKADVFSGILSGDKTVRQFDAAVDPTFSEAVSVVTRNPLLKQKMEVEQEVNKLSSLSRNHERVYHDIKSSIAYSNQIIKESQLSIERLTALEDIKPTGEDEQYRWFFPVKGEEEGEVELIETDRDKLAQKIGRIIKKEEKAKTASKSKALKVGDTVSEDYFETSVYFEDKEVIVRKYPDDTFAEWILGDKTYVGSAALERTYQYKDGDIKNNKWTIDNNKKKLEKYELMIGDHGENPYKADLEIAKEKLSDIDAAIASGKSEAVDEDINDESVMAMAM
jgi:N12 class adenine-specific DNA methylase